MRVVTPDQFRRGYLLRLGDHAQVIPWKLIRRLPDGNYLAATQEQTRVLNRLRASR